MKTGANTTDQKMIAHYASVGGTVEQISTRLKILPEVVKNFMPEVAKEVKKKVKAKNKKAKENHQAIMAAKTTPAIDPTAPRPKSE